MENKIARNRYVEAVNLLLEAGDRRRARLKAAETAEPLKPHPAWRVPPQYVESEQIVLF